ncbi:hypothetical protein EVAR_39736_1 [Eumeta japonica]|uniref:Uncharacterized protein n=1 Tax=Eumeta variegata TaxID=151549 RepID=A0A4C1X4G3_EUMVA|nr:hypothetical protein EVAR_39736_1 [Eumeta japonica]
MDQKYNMSSLSSEKLQRSPPTYLELDRAFSCTARRIRSSAAGSFHGESPSVGLRPRSSLVVFAGVAAGPDRLRR